MVELQPTGTQMLLGADSGFILTGIESLLSGPCEETPPDRRLTEIDLALARRLFDGLLAQLTVVWRDLAGVELALAGVDIQLETAQVAPVSEPTLELAMRARMRAPSSRSTLLVPHRAIAPVEERILGRRGDGDEPPDPADRPAPARGHGRDRGAAAGARSPGRRRRPRRCWGWRRARRCGSAARVGEGLGLCVEGVRVLRAKPGRSGSRRAVQVLEAIEPDAAEGLARLATTPAAGPAGRRRRRAPTRRSAARSARCRCASGPSSARRASRWPRSSPSGSARWSSSTAASKTRSASTSTACASATASWRSSTSEWAVRIDAVTGLGGDQ